MRRVRVGRVGTTSWPVSGGEGGVEGVAGTGSGLGGGNASSAGWYSGDVGVGEAVGCRYLSWWGWRQGGIVLVIGVEGHTARVTWQGR